MSQKQTMTQCFPPLLDYTVCWSFFLSVWASVFSVPEIIFILYIFRHAAMTKNQHNQHNTHDLNTFLVNLKILAVAFLGHPTRCTGWLECTLPHVGTGTICQVGRGDIYLNPSSFPSEQWANGKCKRAVWSEFVHSEQNRALYMLLNKLLSQTVP